MIWKVRQDMISRWTQPATEKRKTSENENSLLLFLPLPSENATRMIWWLIFFMFDIAYFCYCAIDWRWLFKRLFFLSYRDWHFFKILIRQVFLCYRIVESWRNIPKPLFRLFSVLVKARMDISFWPIKCCLAKTSSLVNVRVKKNWSCKCITSRSVLLPLYSVPFCRYTRGLVQFKQ